MSLGVASKGNAGNQVVNTELTTGGPSGPGGLLNETKDAKNPSTDPNFGEIMKQFQAKYGAKPEKAREIKKTLGKDDFLKIMITQMKNQDPTKPFNADQMAAQMAQYASVEQLQNVNQNIQKLESDNKTAERMQMTGMIGKVVTVDRERFPHVEGQNESLAFALPKDATEVKLTILSEAGETILEKDLGPQKQGEQSFSWDGAKSNTLPAKGGTYVFKIAAKDAKGIPIATNPKSKGRVIGVGFDGGEPFFLVGDAKTQQKITMKNISEIDEAPTSPFGGVATGAGGENGAAGGIEPAANGNKFFSFKKGEGSQGIDDTSLPPEAQAAIARYQAVQGGSQPSGAANSANNSAGSTAGPSGEKGFPSGLSDSGGDTMNQKGVIAGE